MAEIPVRLQEEKVWQSAPEPRIGPPVFPLTSLCPPPLLRVQLFGLQRAWQRCIEASHRADQRSGTQRTCRVQPGVVAHADS